MTGPDSQVFLPLTEATLYILLSLAPGKKHGYAIRQDVEAMSGGRIRLSTSTLYSALGRLLENATLGVLPLLVELRQPLRDRPRFVL